ncbi:spastin-like [Papaver somniferum]|nr:spastin-like [Papaver somniferum]
MNLLKDLFGSVGDILTNLKPTDDHQNQRNQSIEKDPAMENISPSIPGSNERIAYKLKSYFELGQEEIAKAVKAEESGLIDDAITHYKNAHRILLEAKDTRPPSYISSSEQEKVKTYYQKISKWQGQVSERLQVLSRRTASSTPSTSRTFVSSSSPISGTRRNVTRAPLVSGRNNVAVRNQTDSTIGSKPARESGNYDSKLVEMIESAIVDKSPSVKWEDVAGLEKAKQSLLEMVIIPTQRPDLFPGGTIRRPPKGLLLFGPPGNGKTMLAKAVASESAATFFNISASSLTSKWVGEAEKLVRTLFEVAISRQPSVIFMDEIDSIMSTRLAYENDASRRLKSEFLIQFDGVTSNSSDLVIVIGATNKPQELDDAVLRRLVKRIYVPLPDESVRRMLFKNKLKGPAFSIPGGDLERLVKETEGYSGSDLQALCEEAAMMPIRELGSKIRTVKPNQIRPLRYGDFKKAMSVIRPSLQKSKWEELEKWNQEFGSN